MYQVLLVAEEGRAEQLYQGLANALPGNTYVTAAYDEGEAKDFLSPEPEISLVIVGMFPGRVAHTFGGPDLIRDMRRVGHTFPIVVVSGSARHNQEALDAGATWSAELQDFRSIIASALRALPQ